MYICPSPDNDIWDYLSILSSRGRLSLCYALRKEKHVRWWRDSTTFVTRRNEAKGTPALCLFPDDLDNWMPFLSRWVGQPENMSGRKRTAETRTIGSGPWNSISGVKDRKVESGTSWCILCLVCCLTASFIVCFQRWHKVFYCEIKRLCLWNLIFQFQRFIYCRPSSSHATPSSPST